MVQMTLKIDGMQCGMCESHVNDTLRAAFPLKKVCSSHSKGETVLVTAEEIPEDASFDALVEESLSHSMKIDPSLVAEFDTAKSCDGATSAMAKKVLLFMTLERELGLQLPALETARVKTLEDISQMVFRTMQNTAVWQSRIK